LIFFDFKNYISSNKENQMKTLIGLAMVLALNGPAAERILTYHEGDRVPVTLTVKGVLGETEAPAPVYVTIKRTFYVKQTAQGTMLSFDGDHYRPYHELIDNTLTVQAEGGDPAPIAVGILTMPHGNGK